MLLGHRSQDEVVRQPAGGLWQNGPATPAVAGCSEGAYLFFFFQAEDGIRDVAVTGVQTCALPISNPQRNGTARVMLFMSSRAFPPRAQSVQGWHLTAMRFSLSLKIVLRTHADIDKKDRKSVV